MLRVIAGFLLACLILLRVVSASSMAAVATKFGLDPKGQVQLLLYANAWDPCNYGILEALGDNYFRLADYTMAAVHYGQGIRCSPGNAVMRFKYGETLILMGSYYGLSCIADAIKLDKHNPTFKAEFERLTKILQPSP